MASAEVEKLVRQKTGEIVAMLNGYLITEKEVYRGLGRQGGTP